MRRKFQFPKAWKIRRRWSSPCIRTGRGPCGWERNPGLARYANGQCTWFTRKDGLVLPDVRVITEDADGTLWFGMSGGGLGRLKEGKLTQFRRPAGLANDFVWSLLAEKDGTLWVGTFGGGLCRLRNGRFATISTREGLPNNVICHIADDGQGNFWISSYGGIFRVSKEELNRCADGQLKAVNCLVYGKAEGLSTLECSGGFQSAGCQTPDGQLWFPTIKGLAVVDPASVKINPFPPPVLIEEVTVDDQPVPLPGPDLSVPPPGCKFSRENIASNFVTPASASSRRKRCGSSTASTDWSRIGWMSVTGAWLTTAI